VTTAAPDALKRAEEIDADGVLAKPFEAQRFIELAQQHLTGNAAR
jgi:hypothetical protein